MGRICSSAFSLIVLLQFLVGCPVFLLLCRSGPIIGFLFPSGQSFKILVDPWLVQYERHDRAAPAVPGLPRQKDNFPISQTGVFLHFFALGFAFYI